MLDATAVQKDRLMRDLRTLMTDAEALLQAGADDLSRQGSETREQMASRVQQFRQALRHWQSESAGQARAMRDATQAYVHEHPWTAIGVAGATGLLLGLWMTRR